MKKFSLLFILFMAMIFSISQGANAACPEDGATPLTIGPEDLNNGFPLWVEDTNGLRLQLCLDGNGADGPCLFDPPDVNNPFSVQVGFGPEAFWSTADTSIDLLGGGNAILVIATEAAWLNEEPVDGDQFPFTRLRIRIDIAEPGDYTVIHPYGQITYTDVVPGPRAINDSFDIPITAFNAQHQGRIGPFLTWDPNIAPLAPAGYIGDGVTEHEVTGSPCGTNFFQIIPPPDVDLGNGLGMPVENNLFVVSGKISTITGVTVKRSTYTQFLLNGNGRIDVVARSAPGQTLQITGVGSRVITMIEDPGTGKYFARFSFTAAELPDPNLASIVVTNTTDEPDTQVTSPLSDVVTVQTAKYTTTTQTLELRASSTDANSTHVITYTDQDGNVLGTANSGVTFTGTFVVPPTEVTATSAAGGSQARAVVIVGVNVP